MYLVYWAVYQFPGAGIILGVSKITKFQETTGKVQKSKEIHPVDITTLPWVSVGCQCCKTFSGNLLKFHEIQIKLIH